MGTSVGRHYKGKMEKLENRETSQTQIQRGKNFFSKIHTESQRVGGEFGEVSKHVL